MKGPAWLVLVFFGLLMLASPVIAGQQEFISTTVPSESTKQVGSIPDPNYKSFNFLNDVSVLDLRAADESPWYSPLLFWETEKSRIKPAVLRNYMVVKKIAPANAIHIVYSASGELDVKCLTHKSIYKKSSRINNDRVGHAREIIADVSAMPVGSTFEIIIEATYWDSFSGESGDDYTTYAHNQQEAENISVILIFPEGKRFTSINVEESALGIDDEVQPFSGVSKTHNGDKNTTFYWNTISARPEETYKFSWKW
jgi:hypothetical protein